MFEVKNYKKLPIVINNHGQVHAITSRHMRPMLFKKKIKEDDYIKITTIMPSDISAATITRQKTVSNSKTYPGSLIKTHQLGCPSSNLFSKALYRTRISINLYDPDIIVNTAREPIIDPIIRFHESMLIIADGFIYEYVKDPSADFSILGHICSSCNVNLSFGSSFVFIEKCRRDEDFILSGFKFYCVNCRNPTKLYVLMMFGVLYRPVAKYQFRSLNKVGMFNSVFCIDGRLCGRWPFVETYCSNLGPNVLHLYKFILNLD